MYVYIYIYIYINICTHVCIYIQTYLSRNYVVLSSRKSREMTKNSKKDNKREDIEERSVVNVVILYKEDVGKVMDEALRIHS